MSASTPYSPAETARRRACELHKGTVNPFCFKCYLREAGVREGIIDSFTYGDATTKGGDDGSDG
jgi:hypothetical protein